MNWYEEYIEEDIRPLVRLLRDNGVNSVSSCGHDMYVDCHFITDGEMKRIDDLLFNNGFRNYRLNFWVMRKDGHLLTNLTIKLDPKV